MKSLTFLLLAGTALIFWYSCASHDISRNESRHQISIRWVKSHRGESRDDMMRGLAWNLSLVGAWIPPGGLESILEWKNSTTFILDVSRLGYPSSILASWELLLTALKNTDEYRVMEGVDAGRFVALTLNSSWHYYGLTGASLSLNGYKSRYSYAPFRGAVVNSSVAFGHREVMISTGSARQISFIAAEGEGSLKDQTFSPEEYETLDVMQNGQLRFALYDDRGQLKSHASPELTAAGKPAKCLWCHEVNIQALNVMEDVQGYYTYEEFRDIINNANATLSYYRKSLQTGIDFDNIQDHVYGEIIYVSFMEPSAERLAEEWQMPLSQVEALLGALVVHRHDEFDFLGDKLYRRREAEVFSPYTFLAVPDDARESSSFEPALIRP